MGADRRSKALRGLLEAAGASQGAPPTTISNSMQRVPMYKTWSSFPGGPPKAPTGAGRPLVGTRVPVFVDGISAEVFVAGGGAIVQSVATAVTAAMGPRRGFFEGNDSRFQAGIRGRRLAGLRAQVFATFQDNATSGPTNTGDVPDIYASEQLEQVLEAAEVTVFPSFQPGELGPTQTTHAYYPTYATRPWPLYVVKDGLILPEHCRPRADNAQFHIALTFPADLTEIQCTNDVAVTVEFYFEAAFV